MPKVDKQHLRVILTGGGTGGHLFPALGIAEALRIVDSHMDIRFVGSKFGIEARILPAKNEIFYPLNIQGIQRSFHPRAIVSNVVFLKRFRASRIRCDEILDEFQPHIVVGTGGYASGLPVLAAQKRGIPTIIQEQNSYPGLTNRKLGEKANLVCIAYKEAGEYFKGGNILTTGTPSRFVDDPPSKEDARMALGLPLDRPIIFILGGSQGSRPLNSHFIATYHDYVGEMGMHLFWQTGWNEHERVESIVGQEKHVTLARFVHDMPAAYQAADLVICRAGAMTLNELAQFGKPSILVPLPTAAGNHQLKNARVLEDHNAARVIEQKSLGRGLLESAVQSLFRNPGRMETMAKEAGFLDKRGASELIVKHILKLAKN